MIEFDDNNADSLSNNRTLTDSKIIILLINWVLVFFQKQVTIVNKNPKIYINLNHFTNCRHSLLTYQTNLFG